MGEILTKLVKNKSKAPATKQKAKGEGAALGWAVNLGAASEFRIVVCGSGGVGKSAFTIQFVSNHFVEDYDPTIEDSYRKQQTVDGQVAMFEILDTAGQEEFSAMRDQWFRQGDAFIILYTITERSTFEEVQKFFSLILKAKDADRPGPMILVGNKCDLEDQRKVSVHEGTELAKTLGIPFLEASAKTRTNIDEAFFDLVRIVRSASDHDGGGGSKKK